MMQEKAWKYLTILSCCFFFNAVAQTSDTSFINKLNERSFKLLKKAPDSAVYLAQRAIDLSEKINYPIGLGDGYIRLGLVEKDKGNYNEALALYRKSLTHRLKVGNEDLIARVYNNMGMAFTWQAKYDSSVHYLLMALKIAERLQLRSYQATYLMNLGIAYESNKDYDQAIRSNLRAKALYREEKDSIGILKATVNLAGIYYSKGDYSTSLVVSREALQSAEMQGDDINRFKAMGNMAAAFQQMKKNDSALYYMHQSLHYKIITEDKLGVALDMNNMGAVFNELGKPDSSVFYLKKSLALAEEIGEINLASRNAEALADIFSKKGDYQQAFENQQKFSMYHDSVFTTSKAEAIADMQTRYETQKKEKEIQLLNKDNEIKSLAIKKQTVIRNSLLVGTLLLVIIGMLLFNRFRISQLHKQQAERLRISSDLHDEVGSTLSSVSLISSHAANQLSENKIADAAGLIREVSATALQMGDDMNDIIWAINPRNDTFESIITRLKNYASRLTQSKDIVLNFHADETLNRLELEMEERKNLYLICKEAINNAVKYSACKSLTVKLEKNKNQLCIEVSDDGCGFDLHTFKEGWDEAGNGLKNMHNRAEDLNATLKVSSQPEAGTKIKLTKNIF